MELQNQNIFILGTAKFDGPYESTSFTIAKYLAKSNNVFYIENPFTWKDYFKQKGTPAFERRKAFFSKSSLGLIDTEIPSLKVVITPPLLSLNFLPEGTLYRKLLPINEKIIAKRINSIKEAFNIKELIYINSFNFHYPNVADLISPKLSVYHCVDPLIIPFDMKHGLTSEPILMKKSDIVISTSKQLQVEKKAYNPSSYFIPNAADIAHSKKALDPNLEVYEDIKKIPGPIIGYFGNIERRMDFPLIQEVALANPDKNFVFVGPVSPEFIPDWFLNTDNIKLIGRQPYEKMPSIIKGFDIAMIPFKKDDVSSTIFPLKLFEYLGAGKPVISTDFNPDLRDFTQDTVKYCSNSVEFTNAITIFLENNEQAEINNRIKVAEENTWENRVNDFASVLLSHLP